MALWTDGELEPSTRAVPLSMPFSEVTDEPTTSASPTAPKRLHACRAGVPVSGGLGVSAMNSPLRDIQLSVAPSDSSPSGVVVLSGTILLPGLVAELARAREHFDRTPILREDLVTELREQITGGAYDVPSDAIARRLLGRR
jgi:hypothetical protein